MSRCHRPPEPVFFAAPLGFRDHATRSRRSCARKKIARPPRMAPTRRPPAAGDEGMPRRGAGSPRATGRTGRRTGDRRPCRARMTPSPPGAGTFPAAARPRGGSVRRTAGKGPWRAVPPRPLAGSPPSSLPFDHLGGDAFAVGDETRICALVIGAHSLRSGVGRAPRGRTGPGSATGIIGMATA